MKDLHSNLTVTALLNAVVVSATGSVDDIDLKGFNSAEFVIDAGADAGTGLSASHKLVFTLQHADDNGAGAAGTYAACATADVLGTLPTIDSTDEDNTVYRFGYVGGKRFVKLIYTETGTVSMPMSMMLIKGHPTDSPTS